MKEEELLGNFFIFHLSSEKIEFKNIFITYCIASILRHGILRYHASRSGGRLSQIRKVMGNPINSRLRVYFLKGFHKKSIVSSLI